MRIDISGGMTLKEFTEQLEAAAREPGFVLVDDPRVFANDNQCDCAPGAFEGGDKKVNSFDAGNDALRTAMQSEAEDADQQDRLAAVAQLGRIVETVSTVAVLHARLLAAVLGD
jgi:hypothetical protein